MRKLIRPELENLKPYAVGLRSEGIWLDANESPWDINEQVSVDQINRYPKAIPQNLITQLASIYQIQPNQLLLTRGSDEGIDILVRLFCRPYQDVVMTCPPTFAMYEQSATLQGTKVVEIPLLVRNDFKLDIKTIIQSTTPETKIIFICSPNNPTGNLIPIDQILSLVESVKDNTIVAVDEAYIEFAQVESMTKYINQFSNLVVFRTLSKAFGLAGLRCGFVISQAPLIEMLRGIMPPYPFSQVILNAIAIATQKDNLVQINKNITYIKIQKEVMRRELNRLSMVVKVFESEANFLLVQFKDANQVIKYCAANGIYLKGFSDNVLKNSLRISIGLEVQNQRLLTVLKALSNTK